MTKYEKKVYVNFSIAFFIIIAFSYFFNALIAGVLSIPFILMAMNNIYDQRADCHSLLTFAIGKEDIKYVKHLLENNTDPNEKDGYGKTPLVAAIDIGGIKALEIIKILISNGAELVRYDERKPLFHAIKSYKNIKNRNGISQKVIDSYRYREIIHTLLEFDDPNWRNNSAITRLFIENDLDY